MKKPRYNFARYHVDILITKTRNIIAKMTGNPDFPTPDPALADVKALVDDLEKLVILAADGSHPAHDSMIAKRKELELILRSLGLYVDKIAQGDILIIDRSGFEINKDTSRGNKAGFWIDRGGFPGEVECGCARIKRSKSYVWQYYVSETAPTDATVWVLAGVSTQIKMTISDLDSGKKSVDTLLWCFARRHDTLEQSFGYYCRIKNQTSDSFTLSGAITF